MEGKYLITTDDWFTAPNGRSYKAIFGEVVKDKNISEGVIIIGSEENHVILSGKKVNYAIRCNDVNRGRIKDFRITDDAKVVEVEYDCDIYIAE